MIINIEHGTFGSTIRNGDMIGIINIIQFLRKETPDLKFFIPISYINQTDYCLKFFNFLCDITDFFSRVPGENSLSWSNVNVWDFRDISGDVVSISNNVEMKKKIVIFPLFDAPYNCYRNWPIGVFQCLLNEYKDKYLSYEKVICISQKPQNILIPDCFTISTDFMENIHHIMDCEIFIGGDTGTSHFASALDRGPKQLIYALSSRSLLHTLPFHVLNGKGHIENYWLNLENTIFPII